MKAARRVPRAFTLLELLLALGMTVMIGAVLASTLFTTFKAKSAAEAAIRAARGADAVTDILSADLAAAAPPTGIFSAAFQGSADGVTFYASGGDARSVVPGDIKKVEFYLSQDDPNTLVRRVTTNLTPGDTNDPPPEEPLARGVTDFSLSYYDGSGWTDTWDSTAQQDANGLDTMPLAVQFTLTLVRENEPPLRVTKIVALPCAQPPANATNTNQFGGGF